MLSVKRTNTVIENGEFAWEAPRLYKYGLRVRIPGKEPYETSCAICATGIRAGMVVLGRLHSQGVLTDAEFAAEKARILAG